jgi:DNA-binding MarR family transcriptional regulator
MVDSAGVLFDRVLQLTLTLERDMQDELGRRGLTPSRAHVLWELWAHREPLTQNALAKALEVTPRSVTALVDGLVLNGFVSREPHPSDRRAVLVTLTPSGREQAVTMVREREELADRLFGGLDESERATAIAVLESALGTLVTMLADAGGAADPADATERRP